MTSNVNHDGVEYGLIGENRALKDALYSNVRLADPTSEELALYDHLEAYYNQAKNDQNLLSQYQDGLNSDTVSYTHLTLPTN